MLRAARAFRARGVAGRADGVRRPRSRRLPTTETRSPSRRTRASAAFVASTIFSSASRRTHRVGSTPPGAARQQPLEERLAPRRSNRTDGSSSREGLAAAAAARDPRARRGVAAETRARATPPPGPERNATTTTSLEFGAGERRGVAGPRVRPPPRPLLDGWLSSSSSIAVDRHGAAAERGAAARGRAGGLAPSPRRSVPPPATAAAAGAATPRRPITPGFVRLFPVTRTCVRGARSERRVAGEKLQFDVRRRSTSLEKNRRRVRVDDRRMP